MRAFALYCITKKQEKEPEDRIIDLPNNKFIITNDWDLSNEELIAMMYDLSCDCPLCKKS